MTDIAGALAKKLMGRVGDHLYFGHVSPHKFDRVDLSKIGTGEGNTDFGRGLYGADNPRVLNHYAKQFAEDYRQHQQGGHTYSSADPSSWEEDPLLYYMRLHAPDHQLVPWHDPIDPNGVLARYGQTGGAAFQNLPAPQEDTMRSLGLVGVKARDRGSRPSGYGAGDIVPLDVAKSKPPSPSDTHIYSIMDDQNLDILDRIPLKGYAEGGIVSPALKAYFRNVAKQSREYALMKWGSQGDPLGTDALRHTLGADHEKAIKPLGTDIGLPKLDPHIMPAYRAATEGQAFSPQEQALISYYQSGSSEINRAARMMSEGREPEAREAISDIGLSSGPHGIDMLDNALNRHSLPGDTTLWRGLRTRYNSPDTGSLYRMGRDIPVGTVLGSKGYVSTSLDPMVADNFGETSYFNAVGTPRRPTIFAIEAPEGQPGAFMRSDMFPQDAPLNREAEFLMPRGTQFEVSHPPVMMPRHRQALLVPLRVRKGDPVDPAGYIAGVGGLGVLSRYAGGDDGTQASPDALPAYAEGGTVQSMFGGENVTPYSNDGQPLPEALDRSVVTPQPLGPDVEYPPARDMDSSAPVTYQELLKRFGMRDANRFLKDDGDIPKPAEPRMDYVLKAGDSPELVKYFSPRPKGPQATGEARTRQPTIRDWVRQHLEGAPKRAFQNMENSGVRDWLPGADIASILERKARGERVDPEEDFGAMLYALPGFKLPLLLGGGMGIGSGVARGMLGDE